MSCEEGLKKPAGAASNKRLCEICKVSVTQGKNPEQSWELHVNGKKHKDNDFACNKSDRALVISGFTKIDSPHMKLKEYFSQFGDVEDVLPYAKKSTVVCFVDAEGYNKALGKKQHVVCNLPITIKTATQVTQPQTEKCTKADKKVNNQQDYYWMKRLQLQSLTLQNCKTVIKQTSELIKNHELPSLNKEIRAQFARKLERTLKYYIPEVRLHVYGSTETSLATMESNLNLSLELDPTVDRKELQLKQPLSLPDLSSFPNLQVVDGRITLESFRDEPANNKALIISKIIAVCNLAGKLCYIQTETSSRIPLINFSTSTTEVFSCDVTFDDSISIQRTGLIKLLLDIDDRFRPLAFAICFWAKQHGISHDLNYTSMSNYALFLLIYFYLQNTKPPIMPTVDDLAKLCEPEEKIQASGWDCHYTKDTLKIRRHLLSKINTVSFEHLLKGFFMFYANMDITRCVIGPKSGQTIPVLIFRRILNCPGSTDDHSMGKFALADMNIQDPFQANHNVVGHVDPDVIRKRFSKGMITAAESIIRESAESIWSLTVILPQNPFHPVEEKLNSTNAPQLPKPEDDVKIIIPFQLDILPVGFLAYDNIEVIEQQWYQWIVEISMRILKMVDMEYKLLEGFEDIGICKGEESTNGEWSTDMKTNKRKLTECDNPESNKKLKRESETCCKLKYDWTEKVKQETVFDCKTYIMGWFRNQTNGFDVDPKCYEDVLSYHEELARRFLQLEYVQATKTKYPFLELKLKIQRYSEGHVTYIKIFGENADESKKYIMHKFMLFLHKWMPKIFRGMME